MKTILLVLLASAISATSVCSAEARCKDFPSQVRFVPGDGDVLDLHTHLVWMRCSLGMRWTHAGCMGDMETMSLGQAKSAADAVGHGWRVPTADELFSLVDHSCGAPAIDTTAFPDIRPNSKALPYWTTTPLGIANLTVYIDFSEGFYDGHSRGFPLAVRLVRSAR